MNKTLFLIFSAAIFIFSVICICSAPIINKVKIAAYDSLDWGYLNCQKDADNYKILKEAASALSGDDKDKYLKQAKKPLNLCNRKKAVYGLEYSSLIIDIILGFLCLILGFLQYFDVVKSFDKVTGIIGLATGIIQFILTFVYICYSGYIFTNDGPQSSDLLKANSDGVIATWDGSKYNCDFYDKDDDEALYAKYSDLGKKLYNYDKDVEQAASTDKVKKCQYPYNFFGASFTLGCNTKEGYLSTNKYNDCDNLYVQRTVGVENKYLYDRWVTTIIFSCFIIACDIGLAIFGFFLFKSNGSGI